MKFPACLATARLSLFIILCSLSSCYAYKVYPKAYRHYEYKGKREVAYVQNPQRKKEFDILKSAALFELTSDSIAATVIIRLHPMNQDFLCGQPIMLSLVTFGQYPVYFPDRRIFHFDETRSGVTISKNFELQVVQRYWFWDMFTFDKNFKHKAGQALAGNYFNSTGNTSLSH